nr:reverse transcriptase [Tanacetum cinerariifolium]
MKEWHVPTTLKQLKGVPIDVGVLQCVTDHVDNFPMGINEKLNNLLLQFNYLVADVNRLKGGKGSSRFSMLSKLEFPKFYSEDIQGWMFRVRQFFTLDGVHEEDKVTILYIHLHDNALT